MITINCKFINNAKIIVKSRFNVLNKSDHFNIRGSIKKFETSQLAIFLQNHI